MSRLTVALLGLGLAALVLPAPAGAQTGSSADDGCTQANPCPWFIEVGPAGFETVSGLDFTVGDWFEVDLWSYDENRSHTVSLSGHDVSVTVGAFGHSQDAGAFRFDEAGTFTLRDEPTGDTRQVRVTAGDSLGGGDDDGGDEDTPDSGGIPGPGPALLLLALAFLVATLRRR